MTEPVFKPEVWVVFEEETTGGFGRIVGAYYEDEAWYYNVAGSLVTGELTAVHEDHITLSLQNGSWMAPSRLSGGQGSVYTDTTPSL